MSISPSGCYVGNNITRLLFEETHAYLGSDQYVEIMRRAGLDHYLTSPPPLDYEKAVDMAEIAAFAAALDELPRTGGWPPSYHVARRDFKRSIKEFGTSINFHALPAMLRMKMGIHLICAIFTTLTDQLIEIRETEHAFEFLIKRCPACIGRTADHPICEMMTGALSEGLLFVVGRHIHMMETTCMAMGHKACTFLIPKANLMVGPMQPPPKTL
jgi:predicted hydrocarbon binding protein